MKKILEFIKPYTLSIVFVLILIAMQSMCDLFLPALMSEIITDGVMEADLKAIYEIGFKMSIVVIAGLITTIYSGLISSKIAAGFSKLARNAVFEKVEQFSKKEFSALSTSSLITRITNDVTQVQTVILMSLRMIVTAPLMCIGGIVMVINKGTSLSALFIVVLPIVLLVIFLKARKLIPLMSSLQKKIDKITQVAREKLIGVKVIRAFNKEKYESERYDKVNKDAYITHLKGLQILASMMPTMMLIIQLNMVAILWFGAEKVESAGMQVGDLMAFIQYANLIMFSVIMLTMVFVLVPRGIVSARRIAEVLNTPLSIKDKKNAIENSNKMKKGTIEFKNVSFRFDKNAEPVLKNISFKIESGETLAILGGTGSGKTTMLDLMMRFYDPTEGEVFIGGQNLKDVTLKGLRNKIGYVPQKAYLFSGNIENNIRYGKEDATDEEVELATSISGATDFVNSFHSKFKHHIAQGGTNLSGGQKQRVSIARAVVKKPDIYIFDDSFSALDYATDAKVRKSLNDYAKDATKVIVAQRVSTVMNADKIILIDDGEIIGIGNHKDLYKTNQVYKEIVESQISKKEAMDSGR